MKEEKSENKNEPITSNLTSDFLLLFSDIKEQIKLLKSFITYINEYFDFINVFHKQLIEINNNFLKDINSLPINSPIFLLGKSIKDIIQLQITNLSIIINNQKTFIDIAKEFSNLIQILKEYQNIMGDNSNNSDKIKSQIQPVLISLMEVYSDIEFKTIDEYINKKYNKRMFGEKNIVLDTKLVEGHYLEKTFLEFEENSKKNFFIEYHEIENKTLNSFNIIKEHLKNISEIILKQNYINLEQIQNQIDFIGKSHQIEEGDKTKDSNQNIQIKNEGIFKYRIKIILQPEIQVIDIKKEKLKNEMATNNQLEKKEEKKEEKKKRKSFFKKVTKEKDKEKEKAKNKLMEDKNKEETLKEDLILTDEDIYNIVETLYKFDFEMLDKSSYILEIEKQKLEVEKLGKKFLSFDLSKNMQENISDSEVNDLIGLLNNEKNINKFFLMLNNYRATGCYETSERAYNILINIFKLVADYLMKNNDITIENLIIILSQTFYILKDGEKIYIQDNIKNHPLFKSLQFWENQIMTRIEKHIENTKNDLKKMNLIVSEKDMQRRLDDIILSQFVPISSNMRDFGLLNEFILKIANNLFEKYNTKEETKTLILSLLK